MVGARGFWPTDGGNTALALKETAAKGIVEWSSCRLVVMSHSVMCEVDVKEGEVDKTVLEEGGGVP